MPLADVKNRLSEVVERLERAIIEFVYGSLAANPARVGKPLKLDLEGLRSAQRNRPTSPP